MVKLKKIREVMEMTRKQNRYLLIEGALCIISLALIFSLYGTVRQSVSEFYLNPLMLVLYALVAKPLFAFSLSAVAAAALLKRQSIHIPAGICRGLRVILYVSLAVYLLAAALWYSHVMGTAGSMFFFRIVGSEVPFILAGVLTSVLYFAGDHSQI